MIFQGGGSVVSREPQDARILSVDVGSSSVRAELYDDAGEGVEGTEVKLDYEFEYTPEGGAEKDADELLDLVVRAVDGTLSEAGGAVISGVAMSTFWHSVLGLDRDGRPTTVARVACPTPATVLPSCCGRATPCPRPSRRRNAGSPLPTTSTPISLGSRIWWVRRWPRERASSTRTGGSGTARHWRSCPPKRPSSPPSRMSPVRGWPGSGQSGGRPCERRRGSPRWATAPAPTSGAGARVVTGWR